MLRKSSSTSPNSTGPVLFGAKSPALVFANRLASTVIGVALLTSGAAAVDPLAAFDDEDEATRGFTAALGDEACRATCGGATVLDDEECRATGVGATSTLDDEECRATRGGAAPIDRAEDKADSVFELSVSKINEVSVTTARNCI